MIEIYPSKLQGAPLETHRTASPMTVEAWLRANVPAFERRESPPISVEINGALIDPVEWDAAEFAPDDVVAIRIEPKGAELFIAAFTLQATFNFVTGLFMPQMPSAAKNNTRQGDKLSEATAKGNKVKLNSPIREIAGRRKVYPDYLVPQHRYFAAPREQWVEMLLCIGKGKYQINPSGVLIGDTPIISLGADAEYTVYQPGANLSAVPLAQWWHSSTEVGATSSGTAGMELTSTFTVNPVAQTSAYVLDGVGITIPSGAGTFPDGWTSGMIVRVEAPYPYTIENGTGPGGRDVISGDIEQLGLSVGDTIEISGDNFGDYIVHTVDDVAGQLTLNYSNGSPAGSLKTGSVSMTIGPRGLRYRLTAAGVSTIAMERLDSSGATDLGWPGFSVLTSQSVRVELDPSNVEGGWVGPFAACPDGEKTQKIEWDIFAPGGIIFVGDDGWVAPPFDPNRNTFKIELQWRDADTAGAWTSVVKSYSGNSSDQMGWTESIEFPYPMRAEVRARRLGAKPTRVNTSSTLQWSGLRALLNAPDSYEGVTTIGLRVRGGWRLSGQAEQLVSVVATRVLPVRNGGSWDVEAPTRDIAPWAAYVARSIGYTDDDIDFEELDRLGEIWSARGDYFDASIESSGTVKEWLNDALAAGFAELTLDRGLIRPVRDEPRTTFEHMYTPQNMTEGLSRQFSAVTPDDFDGVDVEYIDGITWQKETVECRIAGDVGRRVEKVTLEGVTDRTRAWRYGMRRRMMQKYRRWSYSFATEMDALNSRYLSYCALADDVPGYGQSALMLSYNSGIIESSEPLDWSSGGAHVVGIRRPDGTLAGPYTATRIDDYRLSVTGVDFVPDTSWSIEPPHILFGPVTRWSYPALITAINPNGTEGASVEATNYDPRIYQYDNATPA